MPSQPAKLVIALAVFAAIGVIFLGPVADTVASSTGTQTVTNETVTAAYNQTFDLQGYDVNAGSETVYAPNASGTYVVAAEAGNYTFYDAPGEIEFNSSSSLIQEGDEVRVSYTYVASDATTTLVVGFIPLGLGLLIFVGIARNVGDYL